MATTLCTESSQPRARSPIAAPYRANSLNQKAFAGIRSFHVPAPSGEPERIATSGVYLRQSSSVRLLAPGVHSARNCNFFSPSMFVQPKINRREIQMRIRSILAGAVVILSVFAPLLASPKHGKLVQRYALALAGSDADTLLSAQRDIAPFLREADLQAALVSFGVKFNRNDEGDLISVSWPVNGHRSSRKTHRPPKSVNGQRDDFCLEGAQLISSQAIPYSGQCQNWTITEYNIWYCASTNTVWTCTITGCVGNGDESCSDEISLPIQ